MMKVINFDEIDSTNNYIKTNYTKMNDKDVIKTSFQTNGRGQFDRFWLSNKGDNLLFSILLKDVFINNSLRLKEKVTKTLLKLLNKYGLEGTFKEPNDILVNNNKILGILIETKTTNNVSFDYYIIGIGININQTNFNNLNATSFKLLTNQTYNIDEVLYTYLNIFNK